MNFWDKIFLLRQEKHGFDTELCPSTGAGAPPTCQGCQGTPKVFFKTLR